MEQVILKHLISALVGSLTNRLVTRDAAIDDSDNGRNHPDALPLADDAIQKLLVATRKNSTVLAVEVTK